MILPLKRLTFPFERFMLPIERIAADAQTVCWKKQTSCAVVRTVCLVVRMAIERFANDFFEPFAKVLRYVFPEQVTYNKTVIPWARVVYELIANLAHTTSLAMSSYTTQAHDGITVNYSAEWGSCPGHAITDAIETLWNYIYIYLVGKVVLTSHQLCSFTKTL